MLKIRICSLKIMLVLTSKSLKEDKRRI